MLAASVAVAALALAPGQAVAQTQHWSDGDVQIRMANPSLQPRDDGAVHVGGDFIGQVFLEGNDSDQVSEMGFSFGTGPPPPQHSPVHPGLQDFRTDDTREDGWMLPITASDTPAGEYTFAVHAYTAAGDPSSEIARLWGPAVLEDGDATPPWPWILPGETASTSNPHGEAGVTVEFAENATATTWVDGRRVELADWTPPERDNDNVPRQTVEEEKEVLGSGYQWVGPVEEGTAIRVEATDEQGNSVTKAVLVGAGADAPVLEVETPPLSEEASRSEDGSAHRGLTTSVENRGLATAHARLSVSVPDPWTGHVTPANVTLDPGASAEIHVEAETDDASTASAPSFDLEIAYANLETDVTSTFTIGDRTTGAGSAADGDAVEGNRTSADGAGPGSAETNGSPLGLVSGLAALGAAALARRRS